jgi:2-polyprenyl-3-methyl-5-hydroxy-6-metoxy-1,4-benzoquinol methylase
MTYAGREPSARELDDMYTNYPVRTVLNPVTVIRFHELLDRLDAFRSTGRLIDVGSGSGFFLDVARERGWEVHGTEYDPVMVESCTARGFNMRQGPLDPAHYEPGSFDVVTSFEVLEHLVSPQQELSYFHQLLRPGGALYLTTPNFNALSRRISGGAWTIVNYPEHLNYYTPSTIRRALNAAGFRERRIWTTGISVMRLRGSLTQVKQDNTDPLNDDQQIRGRIESSAFLRLVKNLLNGVLALFRSGDTIKVMATRLQ